MNMTPQTKETLDDILQQFKAGNITQDEAAGRVEDLFRREPVNYKRHYSDPSGEPKGPTLAKGEVITLRGFGTADQDYKIMDSSQEKPGASISLQLEPQRGPSAGLGGSVQG